MTDVAILILAAGASARMRGADKLLEPVASQPVIVERAAAALATGAQVYAALPPPALAPDRWQALDGLPLTRVAVPDAATGMAASIRAGIGALPRTARGVMVLLADMPEITTEDMRALIDRSDGNAILRGACGLAAAGHPVLFPARDFAALAQLSGDMGARGVLDTEAARVRLVPLPRAHALTDLDTPEDWARWRSGG